jgi:hypothetical protein
MVIIILTILIFAYLTLIALDLLVQNKESKQNQNEN